MDALIISNFLLWGVVLCLVLVILALSRQIGVLYERVAPMGALTICLLYTSPSPRDS